MRARIVAVVRPAERLRALSGGGQYVCVQRETLATYSIILYVLVRVCIKPIDVINFPLAALGSDDELLARGREREHAHSVRCR